MFSLRWAATSALELLHLDVGVRFEQLLHLCLVVVGDSFDSMGQGLIENRSCIMLRVVPGPGEGGSERGNVVDSFSNCVWGLVVVGSLDWLMVTSSSMEEVANDLSEHLSPDHHKAFHFKIKVIRFLPIQKKRLCLDINSEETTSII